MDKTLLDEDFKFILLNRVFYLIELRNLMEFTNVRSFDTLSEALADENLKGKVVFRWYDKIRNVADVVFNEHNITLIIDEIINSGYRRLSENEKGILVYQIKKIISDRIGSGLLASIAPSVDTKNRRAAKKFIMIISVCIVSYFGLMILSIQFFK